MSEFGQIPTKLICRFGELTKTEIIVLSFLYASKNRKTGQCNPSRRLITEMTGIAKSHVSPALRKLDSDGWICELPLGGFLLTEPDDKVTESVTTEDVESYRFGNQTVTESVTVPEIELPNREPKVTKSVTEVTESVTLLNKEVLEHRKNTEGTQRERAAAAFGKPLNTPLDKKFYHPAIKAIREISKHNPDPATYDHLIELFGEDFDRRKLERCFVAWRLKNFKAANLGWATDWYFNGIPEVKNGNGTNQRISNNGRGKATPAETIASRPYYSADPARENAGDG